MNLRWTKLALLAAVLFSSAGCYRATFYKDPNVVVGEEHDEWSDFFVFGLVGTQHFEVERFCPGAQVAEVRTGGNVGTGVVSVLTMGIYTPRKVYVSCSAGSAATAERELELDVTAAGTPVRARLRSGTQQVGMNIEPTGATTWRLSPRS